MNRPFAKYIDPSVKALIFDCDGTLADTLPVHFQAWNETGAKYGISLSEEEHSRYTGIPTAGIIELLNKKRGTRIDPAAFSREKEARFRILAHAISPIEPVVQVARAFQGRLPMAVVSGGVRQNVDLTLMTIGLAGAFEAVITADDPVPPKPSPLIFLEAARRLAADPSACLVFEDAKSGIEAAYGAGMRVVDIREHLG